MWLDELPNVLWAYRMTARTPTSETPFKFAFGNEAIIPIEVGLASYSVSQHEEGKNDEGLCLHLDLMDEVREMAE